MDNKFTVIGKSNLSPIGLKDFIRQNQLHLQILYHV